MTARVLLAALIIVFSVCACFSQSTSLTLEKADYWGHLSYTITGARLDPPTATDRGNVGGRQYTGEMSGRTLTVSGTARSDNESSGPGSGDYFELVVLVTVGKENKEFKYVADKGEKLNQSFSLSVPAAPGESGSFSISLLEHNAKWGKYGWVVTGSLSGGKAAKVVNPRTTPKRAPKPAELPDKYQKPLDESNSIRVAEVPLSARDAGIAGEIASFKFFSGDGENISPQGLRKYETSFARGSMKAVYFELIINYDDLVNPASYQLTAVWMREGKMFARQDMPMNKPANWNIGTKVFGYGFPNAELWEPGTYTVELTVNGKRIALGSFMVN